MCDICRQMRVRAARPVRREFRLWSGAWVLAALRYGMGATSPHPDAISVGLDTA